MVDAYVRMVYPIAHAYRALSDTERDYAMSDKVLQV